MTFDILKLITRMNTRSRMYKREQIPTPFSIGAVGAVNNIVPVQLTVVPNGLAGTPPYGAVSEYTVPDIEGDAAYILSIVVKKSMIVIDGNLYVIICSEGDLSDARAVLVLPKGQAYLKVEFPFEHTVFDRNEKMQVFAYTDTGNMLEAYIAASGLLLEEKK